MRDRLFQFLCFVLITCQHSYSQDKDSIEVPKHIYYFQENQFNTGDTSFSSIDTTLDHFQVYTNRNHLGNNGLAHIWLTPILLPELGLNYSQNNFAQYSFINNHSNYYNTTAPYTQIFYVLGAKKEQYLNALHTQNVNRNLNFAASFKRARSDGFYQRQNTNHNAFNLSSNYKTANQRYALLSGIIYNSLKYVENGGLKNDTSFESGNTLNKSLIPVSLYSAQRKIRERSAYIKQFINLGSKQEEKINDSVTIKKLIPRSSFSHSVFIQDHSNLYLDNEKDEFGFYSNFYSDTAKAADSLYYWKVENELMWNTIKRPSTSNRLRLGGNIGVKHNYTELKQYVHLDTSKKNLLDVNYNNVIVKGRLFNYGTNQKFLFDMYGSYVVKGYGEQGYDLGLTLKQQIKNELNYIQFQGIAKRQAPDLFYQHYVSNHFIWNNQFEKSSTQWLDLRFVSKKLFLEMGGSIIQYNNFVYLDNVAIPKQFQQNFKIASAFINKDLHIKKFTLSNRIIYQKSLDSSVIRIPEIIAHESLYFTLNLFKKALLVNVGIDIFYNSLYYANAYMPATGQFYLQNSKQIGNYPFFDVFLSMKIKTARIFLKYEHFNAGFMGNTYYAAPNYPMPDQAFKFGINWSVFN